MRRGLLICVLVLMVSGIGAIPAAAQIHGVPPSVTSLGPRGQVSTAPPPSVSSPGTGRLYGPLFGPAPGFSRSGILTGRHEVFGAGRFWRHTCFLPFYPYSMTFLGPYGVPDGYMYPPDSYTGQVEPQAQQPPTTVFVPYPPPEPYRDERSGAAPPAQESKPQPAEPHTATVLVFRDGRRLEIRNYAISGATLFNLSGEGPRKIPLADLDIPATVKANDERGVDFTLPGQP